MLAFSYVLMQSMALVMVCVWCALAINFVRMLVQRARGDIETKTLLANIGLSVVGVALVAGIKTACQRAYMQVAFGGFATNVTVLGILGFVICALAIVAMIAVVIAAKKVPEELLEN